MKSIRPRLKIDVTNNTECHICSEKIKKILDEISQGKNVMILLSNENGERHIHLVSQSNMKDLIAKYGLPFHTQRSCELVK